MACAAELAGHRAARCSSSTRAGPPDAGEARLGARQSLELAVAVPLAFGALVLAAALDPWWAANPVARWLGKVSYGVFLFHFMVMLAVPQRARRRASGPC